MHKNLGERVTSIEPRSGHSNIGRTAVLAKWSDYVACHQRMIDTVQIQWERIIIEQKPDPIGGSFVTVEFVTNEGT
jgi:hypothetical protein